MDWATLSAWFSRPETCSMPRLSASPKPAGCAACGLNAWGIAPTAPIAGMAISQLLPALAETHGGLVGLFAGLHCPQVRLVRTVGDHQVGHLRAQVDLRLRHVPVGVGHRVVRVVG